MKLVIITGGSGYIGSAISKVLLEQGFGIINIDLVSPGKWTRAQKNYSYIRFDLSEDIHGEDYSNIPGTCRKLSKGNEFYGLIHMAAWKDLPGSYDNPLEYYNNNLKSTINAASLAGELGCKTIIFSSSAGVYSEELTGAVPETADTFCGSPYGYTKLVGERIIHDIASQFRMNSFCLRYSNPIGCFAGISADLSDSMFGNIFHALNEHKEFVIFGGDYNTPDGTCIRDYIDLEDIARAHVHFLKYRNSKVPITHETINIGTGEGMSCKQVCELVQYMVPDFKYRIGPRRIGDAAGNWADITLLKQFGFECTVPLEKSIENIVGLAKLNSTPYGKN